MTNSKTTRKALLSSALALLMCVAMLVATTFAWFTDTASTSVNKIQAGTLKVGLEMASGTNGDGSTNWVDAEGKTLSFKKAADGATQEVLWEPGCTYELPAIRVVNEGNLAFKYKLVVSGAIGDTKLLDAIDFTVTDSSKTETKLTDMTGIIIPAGKVATEGTEEKVQYSDENGITIKGHMKEEAGNEYKGLTVSGISVTVYATQYTYEYDSYNNTYDEVDLWDGTVATADELATATNDSQKTVSISSAKLLATFAQSVNNGTSHITTENNRKLAYVGYTITLTEDINLAGVSWTPIGNSTYSFAGTFDGNNHTISGLAINDADGVKDVGLIGYARHATIKNLTVSDAKVSDVGRLGVILGKGEQKNTIQNCTVKDSTITARIWWDPNEVTDSENQTNWNDGDKAGAIAGYLCEGGNVVKGCTVTNCTITGYRDIGGLIGGIGGVDRKEYGEGYKDSVTGNTVANTTIICDKTHDYKKYGDDITKYDVNAIVGEIADQDWNGVTGNTETKVTIIEKTS